MKLFRKIRQKLIEERNLKGYLFYAIGEIFLVMVGILLAFQVSNWNENRIKKIEELGYYLNIKNQIASDGRTIAAQIRYNNFYLTQFEHARKIIEANDRTKMDTLGVIAMDLTSYSDFDRQGNIYETMVNGGEIKLLNNQKIVESLRNLEQRYLYINRMENIHWEVISQYVIPAISSTLKYSSGKVEKPDQLYSYEFQNLFIAMMNIMVEKDEIYQNSLNEIGALTVLIDEELDSK